MTEAGVVVDRWVNTFVVPGGLAASSRAKLALQELPERIDRYLAGEFAEACSDSLARHASLSGRAVWRIRQLDLSFAVDTSAPASATPAQRWGESVAARIADVIDRGAQNDALICFPTRAAYLAQFVLDLAAGSAHEKWYYDEFRSLQHLSPGRAIVESITAAPEDGWAALLHLANSGRLEHALVHLTGNDAALIFQRCSAAPSAEGSAAELSRWSGTLLQLWSDQATHPAQTAHHDALRWMLLASQHTPGAEQDSAARAALDGLLQLRRALATFHSAAAADRLLRDLVEGRTSVAATCSQESPESKAALRFLLDIAGGDSHWATQAAAVLLRDTHPGAQPESMLSGFAGVFLLAPALIELGLAEITSTACSESDASPALLRHILLAQCYGAVRAPEARLDPALCLFSGHSSPVPELPALALNLAAAQRVFLRQLLHITQSDVANVLALVLPLPPAHDVLVLLDLTANHWLHLSLISSGAASQQQALATALDQIRECTGAVPSCALVSPGLGGDANDPALTPLLARAKFPPEKLAALLASTERDLALLAGPAPDSLALFSATIARAAFRLFARCLPGFHASSPDHLIRNFLEGQGAIRTLPDRIEVDLPRVPLSLVLQISGLQTQTCAIPWLEEREVCLLPPPE